MVIPQKSLSPREPCPGLRAKARKGQPTKHAGKQGRDKVANRTLPAQWPFPAYPGPSVREQASYLCVFREENSSEMICFKKLKQKKKI